MPERADQPDRPRQALQQRDPDQSRARVRCLHRADVVEWAERHPVVRPEDRDLGGLKQVERYQHEAKLIG